MGGGAGGGGRGKRLDAGREEAGVALGVHRNISEAANILSHVLSRGGGGGGAGGWLSAQHQDLDILVLPVWILWVFCEGVLAVEGVAAVASHAYPGEAVV